MICGLNTGLFFLFWLSAKGLGQLRRFAPPAKAGFLPVGRQEFDLHLSEKPES
jgi:hypothetical protein